MQKRRTFIANTLELRHFCIKPSMLSYITKQTQPITGVVECELADRGG